MRRAIVLLTILAGAILAAPVQRYFTARQARPSASPHVYSPGTHGPATMSNLHTLIEKSTESLKEKNTSNEVIITTSEDSVMFGAAKSKDSSGTLKRAASSVVRSYDALFHADDDDIRTGFKNSYDMWPFFYQNLYEYEPKKIDVEVDKAKDKRYAISTNEKIIPVHEKVDETVDDKTSENEVNSMQDYTLTLTTDNPNFGNQPFFSYVLNDYFDKTDQDDPPKSKGLPWAKEFDEEMGLHDIDDYAKRIRRLEDNTPKVNGGEHEKNATTFMEHDVTHDSIKGRDSHRASESSEKGDESKHSYDGKSQYDGENYRGFKDFADSFAHRFGLEDIGRTTNYAKKNNADKGEKKKGFRTIYHKDEYQEHHDFFDNSDNSENVEEKGASKVHIGGSEAFLHSLSRAATGNDESKLGNSEHIERNQFERNHEEKEGHSEVDQQLDQYRDVAKRTALSNNADYVDRYLV